MKLFQETNQIPRDIFRAYDIRGVVNDSLTVDIVYTIAKSIAKEGALLGESCFAVACDGRLTSPLFAQATIAGLLDSGMSVLNLGQVPTPLLYFATHFLLSKSGIMVTGSHNPGNYNGLKILLSGKTLADQGIKRLYEHAIAGNFAEGKGSLLNVNIALTYVARISRDISLKRKLKVVVDCGSGVAAKIAPDLYRALGCEVVELLCKIDGNFPCHHPDPTQVQNLKLLQQVVQAQNADLGIAFDGDGDRLGVVTNQGQIIWPDRQLMCFAIDILKRNPGGKVLFDVKCSQGLPSVIAQHGGVPLMWKTGHSFIKNKMREVGAVLAGEMSGHIFFQDRWYGFDDALYAGARLLEIISAFPGNADEFFASLPDSVNTPELHIPCSDSEKFRLIKKFTAIAVFNEAIVSTTDGVRVDFPYGFGLIRPSNTTPNLVLRFEANSQENLELIQDLFKRQLLLVEPDLRLPF